MTMKMMKTMKHICFVRMANEVVPLVQSVLNGLPRLHDFVLCHAFASDTFAVKLLASSAAAAFVFPSLATSGPSSFPQLRPPPAPC